MDMHLTIDKPGVRRTCWVILVADHGRRVHCYAYAKSADRAEDYAEGMAYQLGQFYGEAA
jgi:hypothetical protein